MLDPTLREESILDGTISLSVNKFGELCGIQKGGGVGLTEHELWKLIDVAKDKAIEITNKIVKEVE